MPRPRWVAATPNGPTPPVAGPSRRAHGKRSRHHAERGARMPEVPPPALRRRSPRPSPCPRRARPWPHSLAPNPGSACAQSAGPPPGRSAARGGRSHRPTAPGPTPTGALCRWAIPRRDRSWSRPAPSRTLGRRPTPRGCRRGHHTRRSPARHPPVGRWPRPAPGGGAAPLRGGSDAATPVGRRHQDGQDAAALSLLLHTDQAGHPSIDGGDQVGPARHQVAAGVWTDRPAVPQAGVPQAHGRRLVVDRVVGSQQRLHSGHPFVGRQGPGRRRPQSR